MPGQVSGVEPKAFDNRITISTETPVRPFTNSDRACRVDTQPLGGPSHGQTEGFEVLPLHDSTRAGRVLGSADRNRKCQGMAGSSEQLLPPSVDSWARVPESPANSFPPAPGCDRALPGCPVFWLRVPVPVGVSSCPRRAPSSHGGGAMRLSIHPGLSPVK